jgi:hypothetical protein
MAEGKTVYFDRIGPANTRALAQLVRERCDELGVEHVVVASNSGATALAFSEALEGSGVTLVSVGEHTGFSGGDAQQLSGETRAELEQQRGVKVLICSHALSGVGRSIYKKFGTISHTEIIAYTLRLFGGDGVKVAVEVAVMAADAGLVPTDREIIAAGGNGRGADTAVVLKAAHMNNFFDLEVREIIAKPRQRKKD